MRTSIESEHPSIVSRIAGSRAIKIVSGVGVAAGLTEAAINMNNPEPGVIITSASIAVMAINHAINKLR